MDTQLSRQGFISICSRISKKFRKRIDVCGLLLEKQSDELLVTLHKLWFRERHAQEPYSAAVTIAALDAMSGLVSECIKTGSGDYQHDLRRLEQDSEVLRDKFAERFNNPTAVAFEIELRKFADEGRRLGYEVAKEVRGRSGPWSIRPALERALVEAGLQVGRDSELYKALFEFFKPHFDAGFHDPLPPKIMTRFERDRNERDPSLN